jgi:predicted Zn-dependent peptidase
MCRQRFETDSSGADEICNLLNAELQELAYKGMTPEKFVKLQNDIKRRFEANKRKNGYWLDVYTDSYLFGQNFHNGYESAIEKVTPERFRAFVDMVYRRGNMITVIMEGTTEDVNTQNLFRENQFIKDFFDL